MQLGMVDCVLGYAEDSLAAHDADQHRHGDDPKSGLIDMRQVLCQASTLDFEREREVQAKDKEGHDDW